MNANHVLALGPSVATVSRAGRLYIVTYSATVAGRPRAERFATSYRTKREADAAKVRADAIEAEAFTDYAARVRRLRVYLASRAERALRPVSQFDLFAPAMVAQPVQQSQARAVSFSPFKAYREAVRAGAYAWPGGYPMIAVMDDGDTLCTACLKAERRNVLDAIASGGRATGWGFVALEIHYEGEAAICAHCNAETESAYGNPDAPDDTPTDVPPATSDASARIAAITEELGNAGDDYTDDDIAELSAERLELERVRDGFVPLADAVAPIVERLTMAMPVQQSQARDTRAASPILARLADAQAALEGWTCKLNDPNKFQPIMKAEWDRAFDKRESLQDMALKADPVAYVRAYPAHAFACRHLLPPDMVARIEAAEDDAAMREAVREPAPAMVPQPVQQAQARDMRAAKPIEAPWTDCKVAFGIDDWQKFERWMVRTDDGAGLFPAGWELNEVDASGARCVAVFRVDAVPTVEDGKTVRRLLAKHGGYRAPRATNPQHLTHS